MSSSFTWLSLPLHFQFPPTNLSRKTEQARGALQHTAQGESKGRLALHTEGWRADVAEAGAGIAAPWHKARHMCNQEEDLCTITPSSRAPST